MYKKKTILNWAAFDLLFFILQSWLDVSSFTSFTKIVGESAGYSLGFLLDVEIRVESVLKQMLSEWCTVLLRNLSTALHSGRSGTLLHLLTCPSIASCSHAPLPPKVEQISYQDVTFPSGLICSLVLHSRLLTIKCCSTYKSICEMMPLDIGVFALMFAWFLSAMYHVPLEQSYLNQTRPQLMPHQGSLLTSLGFFPPL